VLVSMSVFVLFNFIAFDLGFLVPNQKNISDMSCFMFVGT